MHYNQNYQKYTFLPKITYYAQRLHKLISCISSNMSKEAQITHEHQKAYFAFPSYVACLMGHNWVHFAARRP